MKRIATVAAIVMSLAAGARGDDLSGRVLLSFQRYNLGPVESMGLRQTYDLRLQRSLTGTSLFRIVFRGDDFSGTTESPFVSQKSGTRQIQPIAEFLLNAETLRIQARSEMLDTDSRAGSLESSRTMTRHAGRLEWSPAALPRITMWGQRNQTESGAAGIGLTDDLLSAAADYEWHGLLASAEQRYTRSADPVSGYSRRTTANLGQLSYTTTQFGGRLSATFDGTAQLTNVDERSVGGKPTLVPVPVAISRAYSAVDDTPTDGRDHPLSPAPLLTDGNTSASAGISLGPDGISFQNLAFDLGRSDRVDEIRVVVRDASGNPLRTGGGAVTWDLYTSEDGQLWTPRSAETSWVGALSHYAVTFPQVNARWFKVVNFGVNVEATLVTELQAYYHAEIEGGGQRTGSQNTYNANATVTARPLPRLGLSYSGVYTGQREDLSTSGLRSASSIEHLGVVEYEVLRALTLRQQVLRRDSQSYVSDDEATNLTTFLEWKPTRLLRVQLELARESQLLAGTEYVIVTRAVHATGSPVQAVLITLDAGLQSQTFAGGEEADRQFANLMASAQLYRTIRFTLSGTLNRTRTGSADPAVQLLGPSRDNRIAGEMVWRPGRELVLSTRLGWVSGGQLSGLTQRYHVEWYPFGDGTVSIGGSYDEDIDPIFDRRARRLVFNPRWMMNRWATFDVNYTAVSSSFASLTSEQRTLFATLTLSR